MSSTRDKQFRVVVQLKTVDLNNAFGSSNENEKEKNSLDELRIIDGKTLRLVMHESDKKPQIQIEYNMRFDCVCQLSDNVQQAEVENFMTNLFEAQQNSCLVRFTTTAECNLRFLYNLLVNSVNGHLSKFQLDCIEIGYCDIRSEDMIDMLQPMRNLGRHLRSTNLPSNSSRTDLTKQRFRTTWSLLSWLLNKFRSCDVSGHEALEIDFTVTHRNAATGQPTTIKLTLTILLVYFVKLKPAERSHLADFFKCGVVNYAHTALSACISEFLKPGNDRRSLLLFAVPLHSNGISIGNNCALELLQLAQAIFVWRNLVVQHKTSVPEAVKPTQANHISLDSVSSLESDTDTALRHLNELVGGYKNIDDAVQNAYAALSMHFEHFYAVKANQICKSIKSDPCNYIYGALQADNLSNEYAYYSNYCLAMSELHLLGEDIKRTRYVDILGLYLHAKREKLEQFYLKIYLEKYTEFQVHLRQALDAQYRHLKTRLSDGHC